MNDEESVDEESSIEQDKAKEEQVAKLRKDLKQEEMKLNELKEKIVIYNEQIQLLQNKLGNMDRMEKAKANAMKSKEEEQDPTLITLQEQIAKLFAQIQMQCNSNLQEKYKRQSIEQLINQEIQLKVSYLIIKKLEIYEEFYIQNKIEENQNFYENLKALNQLNLLNYKTLKNCGPNLVFRLTENSRLSEIKERCCAIWKLEVNSYSLYDDSLANMECVQSADIQKYFSIFQPSDSTLPSGHVCFYLIEKIKNQKGLLSIQEKALSKENSEQQDQGGNYDGGDTNGIIENLKEGKILKGLSRYLKKEYNNEKEYSNVLSYAENNCIVFALVIVLVILSLITIPCKMRNIQKWGHTNKKNEIFLSQINQNYLNFNNYDASFETVLDYFDYLGNPKKYELIEGNFLVPYGYNQIRLFPTKEIDCFHKSLKDRDIAKIYKNIINTKCFEKKYDSSTENNGLLQQIMNEKGIDFLKDADHIDHKFNSVISKYNDKGLVYRFDPYNDEQTINYHALINAIKEMNPNDQNIQAIELSFSFFDPSTNLFISNLILAQREVGKFFITDFSSIPFDSNVYEKRKWIFALDIIRLILAIVLLVTIPIQMYRKVKALGRRKTTGEIIMALLNTFFHLKSIVIIIANAFIIRGFVIFCQKNLNTQKHQNEVSNGSASFIDFYQFSLNQKYARYYDVLSLFLIFLFSLKYFQFFERMHIIMKSFKKCFFEFLIISIVLLLLLIALSLSTTYIYGSSIKEFSTFRESLIVNIQIVLFLEKTNILVKASEFHKSFLTVLLLFAIIVIRLFFLNLFYPILVEYLRVSLERFENTNEKLLLTSQTKVSRFVHFCEKEKEDDQQKRKTGDLEKDFNADEIIGRE